LNLSNLPTISIILSLSCLLPVLDGEGTDHSIDACSVKPIIDYFLLWKVMEREQTIRSMHAQWLRETWNENSHGDDATDEDEPLVYCPPLGKRMWENWKPPREVHKAPPFPSHLRKKITPVVEDCVVEVKERQEHPELIMERRRLFERGHNGLDDLPDGPDEAKCRDRLTILLARLIMNTADAMSSNQELSVSEIRVFLANTEFEGFMDWIIGPSGGKAFKKFDADGGGSLGIDELEVAVKCYLEDELGPVRENFPRSKAQLTQKKLMHACLTVDSFSIKVEGVKGTGLQLQIQTDSHKVERLRLLQDPEDHTLFRLAHDLEVPIMVTTDKSRSFEYYRGGCSKTGENQRRMSITALMGSVTKVAENERHPGTVVGGNLKFNVFLPSKLLVPKLLAEGEINLAECQVGGHEFKKDIELTCVKKDASVKLSTDFFTSIIGRRAYGKLSEHLKDGETLLKVSVAKVEVRKPGGNAHYEPPEASMEYAELPKALAVTLPQYQGQSKDSRLENAQVGWQWQFTEPHYIPLTLYEDATCGRDDIEGFLEAKIKINFLVPHMKIPGQEETEPHQVLCTYDLDVAKYISQLATGGRAIFRIEGDKALGGHEYFAEVNLRLIQDAVVINNLKQGHLISKPVSTVNENEGRRRIGPQEEMEVWLDCCQITGLNTNLTPSRVELRRVPGSMCNTSQRVTAELSNNASASRGDDVKAMAELTRNGQVRHSSPAQHQVSPSILNGIDLGHIDHDSLLLPPSAFDTPGHRHVIHQRYSEAVSGEEVAEACPLSGGPGMVTLSQAMRVKMGLGDGIQLTVYATRELDKRRAGKEVEIRVAHFFLRASDHLDHECHSRRITMAFQHVSTLSRSQELFATFRLWFTEPIVAKPRKVSFLLPDGEVKDAGAE